MQGHEGVALMAGLRCGDFTLDLSRPRVMGIVNVDGRFLLGRRALPRPGPRHHCTGFPSRRMARTSWTSARVHPAGRGAGAEEEEAARVIPVVRALARGGSPSPWTR